MFGEVCESDPVNVHRICVTLRSYPLGAPPPADTGVYEKVAPLSLEYATTTVRPDVPRVFVTEPTLKSVLVFNARPPDGFGSMTLKFVAAAEPVLEKAIE